MRKTTGGGITEAWKKSGTGKKRRVLITAVWAYCTFSACFCFLSMAGRTEKTVNLSLGLSGSPLPPDNVLPMQGVTSLANCHMTAPIRGLKGWHSPGRGRGFIRPLGCDNCPEGASLGSPDCQRHWQWCRSIPGQSLSLIKLWAPARAEVRGEVLGMLFLQPLPGPQNYHGCWERYLDIRQERPQFMSWRWHHGQYLNCPHSPCMCGHYCKLRLWGVLGCQLLKRKINQKVSPQQGNKSAMQSQGISTPPSCLSNELRGR